MFWQEEVETLDRGKLEELQLARLRETITRAARTPFYGELFSRCGLPSVTSLKDLRRLPFTAKGDLGEAFPRGFLAVPLEEVIRLHSSSGTTGNPTVIYHTAADIAAWQDVARRIAHEVKNPLNSMRLWLENLKESVPADQEIPQQAVKILDKAFQKN